MQPISLSKKILPLFFVFVVVNSLLLWYHPVLQAKKIDVLVVFTANILLFFLSVISLLLHTKQIDKKNPNAILRNVMSATLIKMFVLGGAAVFYLVFAKEKSVYAIIVSMALYFIYLFIEISIASKINKEKNGNN
ncbi:MAG: hypothetical protein JST94_12770 [Bacteroidetes bacterium]|nr:hypothetical protein [Bacteroidota bacterium]MBS1638572.1 hypothetical protein [Bacteroidota bacterium]MBS1642281.1 hypothetical protein [Bacteroidota bacterium]MBS1672300.1 hypothetical protein [Bacteroidota bacterium]